MGVIFAVLGGILKWIFLILLGLLALILILLLIVLLTPLRYKIRGEKSAEVLEGEVNVSWLLHLITFHLEYQNKTLLWRFKLGPKVLAASYPLAKNDRKPRRRKTKPKKAEPTTPTDPPAEQAAEEAPPQAEKRMKPLEQTASSGAETVPPAEGLQTEEETKQSEGFEEIPAAPEKKRTLRQKITAVCWKIRRFFEKIIGWLTGWPERIRHWRESLQKLQNRWDEIKALWAGYPQKSETVQAIKELVLGILKAPLPRRLNLQVRFGFNDPATTGQVLAYYYMLWPLLFPKEDRRRRFNVEAEFDEACFEIKGWCRGKLSIGNCLWPVIRALMNAHVRRLIRYIRNIMKKNKR